MTGEQKSTGGRKLTDYTTDFTWDWRNAPWGQECFFLMLSHRPEHFSWLCDLLSSSCTFPPALLLSLSFFHLFTSSAAISSALLKTVSLTLLIPFHDPSFSIYTSRLFHSVFCIMNWQPAEPPADSESMQMEPQIPDMLSFMFLFQVESFPP